MEIWHVLNRGVDKRSIFMESGDYVRFVHDLYEFNKPTPANKTFRRVNMDDFVSRPYLEDRLVEIHGWVLMKNHYHLLLSEKVEGGLSLFLRRLNVGYAKYFNEKYSRVGTLFQGRTKKIQIEKESHFLYIPHYIHLNPLDYFEGAKEWRVRDRNTISNVSKVLEYLKTYRWSSYLDYIGIKNFPSILTTSLFKNEDVFADYEKTITDYLQNIEMENIQDVTLE